MALVKSGLERCVLAILVVISAFGVLAGCNQSETPQLSPLAMVPDGGTLAPLSRVCKSDTECMGKHCDPLAGCVDCLFDSDCGKAALCRAGKCEPKVACTKTMDCATSPNKACDTVAKACVRCLVDKDCGKNEHCHDERCEAFTPCVNTLDCPDQKVCNRQQGVCVGCVANADCGEKSDCVESACVPRCTSDKDCSARGQLCDTKAGHCAQCVQQVDCPEVYHCAAGKCALDVCRKGDQACEGSQLLTCNLVGDGFDQQSCLDSQTCVAATGKAQCKPWVCQPSSAKCDLAHRTLQRCADDGLSVAETIDCTATGKVCSNGECLEKKCEPGKKFCNGSVYQCSEDGATSTLVETCGNGRYCDANAQCAVAPCTAGSPVCNLSVATSCKADGSGPAVGGTDCSTDGRVCDLGACAPKVCEPGTTYCKGSSVYKCSATGASETEQSKCSSTQYCDASGVSPTCRTRQCVPNAPACSANVATTCKADGSGLASGGTDCALDGKVCEAGACVPKVCEPSSSYCKGTSVYRCNASGSSETGQSCLAGQYCNAGVSPPICSTIKCTPGAPVCNVNVVTTCNADGSGFVAGGTDCTTSNKVCVNATCLPKICEPSTYFCSGGNVNLCGSTGATSTPYATCTASYYCQPGLSYCPVDVCVAGAPTCNGDVLSTCLPDGSGPGTSGTDCTLTGKACFAGACKDVVCTEPKPFCKDGNVYACASRGTAFQLQTSCALAQFCDGTVSPAVCRADVCAASSAGCNGESLAVCSADGSGYATTTTDCSASGQVCSISPSQCAASAIDTVSLVSLATNYTSDISGEFYSVTQARTLTQIEDYFSVAGTSIFTWVVYSSPNELNGTYTKIFELTTSGTGVAVFHASGAINVPLEKGKSYFIGVVIAGTHTLFPSATQTGFVSFGQATAGGTFGTSTAPATFQRSNVTSYYGYNQRLTTTKP